MTGGFVYLPNIYKLKTMTLFSRILCRVCCVALAASACPMFVINGMQLIETNISYAGIRLACVLNSIF